MQICKTQLLPGWSCFPVSRYFLLSVCFLLIPQLIIFLFSRRRHPPTPPRPPIPQIPARPPIPPSQDRRFPCFRSFFWLQIGVVYLVAAVASCFELLPRFEVLLALCFFCFESAANRFLFRQRRYRRHTTPPPPYDRRGSCGREEPPPPRCWAGTPATPATTTTATKTTLVATRSTASPSTTATKMLPAFLLALLLEMLAGEGGGGFASFRLV
jgi:hypothetical protein